jgi:2-succinyl-6-hydroxy-2,4-cyclohexadiene-1-carboxylate synthase
MKPVVFLHGFLGHPSDWDRVIAHLPDIPTITIELPGHGNSPFAQEFSFPLPSQTFHLVGYSMGGRLALSYAKKFPERIASLTILSAHPGLKTKEEKTSRLQEDAKWAERLLTLPIDEFLIQWYDQPIFYSFKPDFSMRCKHNPKRLAKTLLYYSLGRQTFYRPKEALYLVGEKDEKYRAIHPEAVVIPKAGHMIHLENPEAVAKIIKTRILS